MLEDFVEEKLDLRRRPWSGCKAANPRFDLLGQTKLLYAPFVVGML
jgi:hypothetical protein